MMAINFPAAAFLASLKGPNQIMYCISQDNRSPVVVYKDSQNVQQTVSVPPWSGSIQTSGYNNQGKDMQQNQHPSTIRVEAGNQVRI